MQCTNCDADLPEYGMVFNADSDPFCTQTCKDNWHNEVIYSMSYNYPEMRLPTTLIVPTTIDGLWVVELVEYAQEDNVNWMRDGF